MFRSLRVNLPITRVAVWCSFLTTAFFVCGHGNSLVLAANGPPNKTPKKPEPPPHVAERHQNVAKVDPGARAVVLASAAKIDEMVDANYGRHSTKPNSMTSDEQFLRRIYLDITGTIPSLKQVRLFASSSDSQKRSKLIDTLLNQEGYASNFYNYWSDILRLKDGQLTNNVPGKPYCEWVKETLETNKPYDRFVYEMLTAEGKVWDNPASGYILRDSGMPLDAMNNTVRVFLGTQIGCAQCHNPLWSGRRLAETDRTKNSAVEMSSTS